MDLAYLHALDGGDDDGGGVVELNKAGRYSLNVSVMGESSADYEVWFSSGSEFVVRGLNDSVSGPLMKRALFSSDGSKILIEFLDSTNEGGSMKFGIAKNCSKLFRVSKSLSSSSSSSSSFFISLSFNTIVIELEWHSLCVDG